MKNSDEPASYKPETPPDGSEKSRIDAIRKGDKTAFRVVFEEYYEPMLCFAFRYVESRVRSEEVVQDVFLWIWEKRGEWDVEGSLKTYLFRAVKYRCLDLLRHDEVRWNYIREEKYQRTGFVNPDTRYEEFDQEKFEKEARKAIEELPEGAQMVYKLSRMEGLTYKEIAAVLEISPKTVESQMSRALNLLRSHLSKYLSLFIMLKKVVDILF